MQETEIIKEILSSLRGRKSQGRIAQLMNVPTNQIYRWENSIRKISWSDFLLFSDTCGVSISNALQKSLGFDLNPSRIQELFTFLTGNLKIVEITEILKAPRQKIARWKKGISEPTLFEVLMWIHTFQNRLSSFMSYLVDIKTTHVLSNSLNLENKNKANILCNPKIPSILSVLKLQQYQNLDVHEVGYLQSYIGCSLEEERFLLDLMLEHHLIRFDGKKYIPEVEGMQTKDLNFEKTIDIRKYHSRLALDYLNAAKQNSNQSMFGWAAFPVSEEKYIEIQRKIRGFYAELTALIEQDKENEKHYVKVLNLQLIDLHELQSIKQLKSI